MKLRLSLTSLVVAVCLAASLACTAHATPIAFFTDSLSSANSTQLGRPSRNGIPQDWLGSESYPGKINNAFTYFYQTYTFDFSLYPAGSFVDISFFEQANEANLFISAYSGSYDPNNRATNWLGDEGGSGNFFGTDARYFDVILPANMNLVLVVNNTAKMGGGLNLPYDVAVNAYADTNFTDLTPIPEPSTLITSATGLLGLAGVVRRRLAARA